MIQNVGFAYSHPFRNKLKSLDIPENIGFGIKIDYILMKKRFSYDTTE